MIVVIIPTYKRPECIEYLLFNSIEKYVGSLFRFEIHDSSDDDETFKIIEKYNIKHLKYIRYDFDIDADSKVINILRNNRDDFFWLLGDGNVVDFNELEVILKDNLYCLYDVINIEPFNRKRVRRIEQHQSILLNKVYMCNDYVEFAQKYFSHLTYWGATIIKKDFFDSIFENRIIDKFIEHKISWWIALCLLENFVCVSKYKKVILGTVYTNYVSFNPYKKDHGWTFGDRYFDYVFVKINHGVSLLPSVYNDIAIPMISFFRNDHLVSNKYLWKLRENGTITFDRVKKYKNDIDVIKGYYSKMLIISLVPRKILIYGSKLTMLRRKCKNFLLSIVKREK